MPKNEQDMWLLLYSCAETSMFEMSEVCLTARKKLVGFA